MAASSWDNPGTVVARRQAIEKAERHAAGTDRWLERIAADRERREKS